MSDRTIVLRITNHPVEHAREQDLKSLFGDDIAIVNIDMVFGDDPRARLEDLLNAMPGIVAIEAIVPPWLLALLMPLRTKYNIKFIRPEYVREPSGRVKVLTKNKRGRDVLAFSRYVEIVQWEYELAELDRPVSEET